MAKRRKCGNHLTAQQEEVLARLVPMRKLLDTAREKAPKEQKELREKLIVNIHKQRKEGKCWYVHMDWLYQMNSVNRESYHMREFSGRPLKKTKKEAAAIFNGANQMLREFKQTGVSDTAIDTLCDESITVLTASYGFFGALIRK